MLVISDRQAIKHMMRTCFLMTCIHLRDVNYFVDTQKYCFFHKFKGYDSTFKYEQIQCLLSFFTQKMWYYGFHTDHIP